jgi:hypothetical protein
MAVQVILPRSLLQADYQFLILLDEGLQQRLISGGQAGNQIPETGVFAEVQGTREMAATLFTHLTNGLERIGLRIDGGDARGKAGGLTLHDVILFLIEQGKHFTVLLKFFAQGVNQMVQLMIHEAWLQFLAKGLRAGWEADAGLALGRWKGQLAHFAARGY